MIEQTVVRKVDDVKHDEAVWLGDANTVVVGSHLTPEQVDQALLNLSLKWQRSFLRIVA